MIGSTQAYEFVNDERWVGMTSTSTAKAVAPLSRELVEASELIDERDYRQYAALMGIEPSAPVTQTPDGQRMVEIDAREVATLRAMAAFASDSDKEEDRLYDLWAPALGVRR